MLRAWVASLGARDAVVVDVELVWLLEKGLAMFDVVLRVEVVSCGDPRESAYLEHPFKMAIPPAVGMDVYLPGDLENWGEWNALIARVSITRIGDVIVYLAEDLSGNEYVELNKFKESVADLVAAGWKVCELL